MSNGAATSRLNLIFARAANGMIGREGQIPWQLPEDMAHFKRLTMGHPVLMGRKTWDSLPAPFQPLPGRRNVVITHDANWRAHGAECATSIESALALCADSKETWIIGGAQIYAQALPMAQRVFVTEIERSYEGDAVAPTLGSEWHEVAREAHTSKSAIRFSFVSFERVPGRTEAAPT